MWKSIEISQQTYFIYCNINDNKEEVTLVLYDLKEAWCQTIAFKDVKLKVKVLNKRYDFNETNIKEALTTGEIKFGAIEEQPHTSAIKQESLLLKVKYGIKNCVLNYEWSLRKQSQLEFQKDFVQPLLVALLGCYQQVEILTECIRKKDAELNQYRREGAVLGRRTLATKPFDFDSFNKTYGESNKTAINFKELAQYVLRTKDATTSETLNDNIKLQPTEDEEKPNNLQNDTNKKELTPKGRKRRKELELLLVERHLKLRKEGLIYESSQSESLSSENSQVHEELKKEIIKEKRTVGTDYNTKNSNDGDDESKAPRKSARSSSPIKQKKEHKINEHSDSDSDGANKSPKTKPKDNTNLKPFRDSNDECESKPPRKSSRSSPIKQKRKHEIVVELSDSDSDDTNKLPKTKSKDNNKLKSLRDRKLNNSPKNSVKTSDVIEFSTGIEDNRTLRERKKSLQERQTKSPAALITSTCVVGSKNLRHSPVTPVVDDISSQLNYIKKELESLDAMRLADLRKRSCKA